MQFRVVSDIPGRLRLRLDVGAHPLFQAEARGLSYALRGLSDVLAAEVHAANASALITYRASSHTVIKDIFSLLAQTNVCALPRREEAGLTHADAVLEESLERNRFQVALTTMVLRRMAMRLLLPVPVRAAIGMWHASKIIIRGLACLVRGNLSVEVLDATAVTSSLLRGAWSEAATIGFLLQLSGLLEEHVESRARLALRDGLLTQAEHVWVVIDGQDVSLSCDEVEEGMTLHLTAGSVLPVDGTVVAGIGEVDEAPMTGEPTPVQKHEGSTVFAGTALATGDLLVRATSRPGASRIDEIVSMVEGSSALKSQAQGRAEHLADAIVPYSMLSFLAILALTRNVVRALGVLMVDYSCAIKLAAPIAVMSATSEASRHGIAVRGGRFFEAVAEATAVVFDKTGTLTSACPRVTRVIPLADESADDVLRLAACIEEHFPHSVARAIVEEAAHKGLVHDRELHAEVNYIVAHGIATHVNGSKVCIGSEHFVFEDEGVAKPSNLDEMLASELELGASSVVFIAREGRLLGALCVADPPRPEARATVLGLRKQGLNHLVMLTGDAPGAASAVASELGLDDYRSQVLPEDKSLHIERLQRQGYTVLMVGDGINDSPALARADVSVALSDASDMARAVADVVIQGQTLEDLVVLRGLSGALMERMHKQNRVIVGFNSLLIVLGVAGLIPLTTAAYLHNASTVAIAAAAARPLLPRPQRALPNDGHAQLSRAASDVMLRNC